MPALTLPATWLKGYSPTQDEWHNSFANLTPLTIKNGATGWLEAVIGATESIGALVSLSPNANCAGVFGTRASDNQQTGAEGGFALGCFALNDNSSYPRPVYAIYAETRLMTGVAAVGQGMEICVCNESATFVYQSCYNFLGAHSTIPILVDAGRTDVPGVDSSIAIAIQGTRDSRDARFGVGVSFTLSSIRPLADGAHLYAQAVQMCDQMSMTWLNPTNGQVGSFITAILGSCHGRRRDGVHRHRRHNRRPGPRRVYRVDRQPRDHDLAAHLRHADCGKAMSR